MFSFHDVTAGTFADRVAFTAPKSAISAHPAIRRTALRAA
ncbi:hypothetical protein ABI_09090 [Asticcacaulis biprosthecium C19]|uniref:Uncharacterized protein n=1 Tax=Asticcacaulis biprosthecium C19 TaxID=715226 RepID=F4QGE4_9CAUL|nr:hypothetical protein ABI_09090 [Asticcacaulis biprosthecium C19]